MVVVLLIISSGCRRAYPVTSIPCSIRYCVKIRLTATFVNKAQIARTSVFAAEDFSCILDGVSSPLYTIRLVDWVLIPEEREDELLLLEDILDTALLGFALNSRAVPVTNKFSKESQEISRASCASPLFSFSFSFSLSLSLSLSLVLVVLARVIFCGENPPWLLMPESSDLFTWVMCLCKVKPRVAADTDLDASSAEFAVVVVVVAVVVVVVLLLVFVVALLLPTTIGLVRPPGGIFVDIPSFESTGCTIFGRIRGDALGISPTRR